MDLSLPLFAYDRWNDGGLYGGSDLFFGGGGSG